MNSWNPANSEFLRWPCPASPESRGVGAFPAGKAKALRPGVPRTPDLRLTGLRVRIPPCRPAVMSTRRLVDIPSGPRAGWQEAVRLLARSRAATAPSPVPSVPVPWPDRCHRPASGAVPRRVRRRPGASGLPPVPHPDVRPGVAVPFTTLFGVLPVPPSVLPWRAGAGSGRGPPRPSRGCRPSGTAARRAVAGGAAAGRPPEGWRRRAAAGRAATAGRGPWARTAL